MMPKQLQTDHSIWLDIQCNLYYNKLTEPVCNCVIAECVITECVIAKCVIAECVMAECVIIIVEYVYRTITRHDCRMHAHDSFLTDPENC